jgi:hypothetical protein
VTIGLFETTETIGQALAKSLTELLNKYGLRKKNIFYVKNEGFNLNAMTGAFKSAINYESLRLKKSFRNTCFGHAFSKACQYGIVEEKICINLKYAFIKSTQAYLQKCITWLKKSKKGKQEWNKPCLEIEIRPENLNNPIKIKKFFQTHYCFNTLKFLWFKI